MTARLIDGKSLAETLRAALAPRVGALRARGVQPALAVILVGEDPASRVYVRNKIRACEAANIRSLRVELPASVDTETVLRRVEALNAERSVHGILVQLPLPPQVDARRVLEAIDPAKDVDGFHPLNMGALLAGTPGFVPCTPAGILALLEHAQIDCAGRHAVIVGRSTIVGKPVSLLLLQRNATVTICHSRTPDLGAETRRGDIVVMAVGRPRLLSAEMVKPGACVIDVGMNRLPDGRLAGDVDFEGVSAVAGWITPVPGGVGPMTVAGLLGNCVSAAERSAAV